MPRRCVSYAKMRLQSLGGSRPIVAHHRIRESRGAQERRCEQPVGVSGLSKCITRLAQHHATPWCVVISFSFRLPSSFVAFLTFSLLLSSLWPMRTLIYASYFSACCGRATRGFRVDTFANESSIDFPWRMARTFDRGEFSVMIDATRRCTLQQFFDGIWFLRSNVKFSAAIKFSMDFSFREEWLRGYLFRNVIGKDDFPPLIRVSSMCYFLRYPIRYFQYRVEI